MMSSWALSTVWGIGYKFEVKTMTHSLYTKFILGYLVFGLIGFVFIATFSSHITYAVSGQGGIGSAL